MADFCKQCALDVWGPDIPNDMLGLISPEEVANGYYAAVLCEGCGVTLVDHEGKCVSADCLLKHGVDSSAQTGR